MAGGRFIKCVGRRSLAQLATTTTVNWKITAELTVAFPYRQLVSVCVCECLLISSDGTAEGRDNGTALCVQLNGSDQRWGEILTRVECMRERECSDI